MLDEGGGQGHRVLTMDAVCWNLWLSYRITGRWQDSRLGLLAHRLSLRKELVDEWLQPPPVGVGSVRIPRQYFAMFSYGPVDAPERAALDGVEMRLDVRPRPSGSPSPSPLLGWLDCGHDVPCVGGMRVGAREPFPPERSRGQ